MSQYQSNIPNQDSAKPRGCRNALIIAFAILLILIAIPVILLIRIQPSQEQWDSLSFQEIPYSSGGFSYSEKGIVLSEERLNFQLNQVFALLLEEEGFPADGNAEIKLFEDAVLFRAAAAVPVDFPLFKDGIFRFMVTIAMNTDMIKGSRLRLELTELKLGRLNLPVSLLYKLEERARSQSPERDPDALGEILSRQDRYSFVDLEALSEKISPGMQISRVVLSPGTLLVSLELSREQIEMIQEFSAALAPALPEIHGEILGEIPSEKLPYLRKCESLMGRMGRSPGSSDEVLETAVRTLTLYDEMWNGLSEEEKERVEDILEEYGEKNPRLMDRLDALKGTI